MLKFQTKLLQLNLILNVKQFSDLRSKHEKLAYAEACTNDDKEEGKLRGAGSVVDYFFSREREDVILAEISSNLAQQPWSMQLMDTSELEQSPASVSKLVDVGTFRNC